MSFLHVYVISIFNSYDKSRYSNVTSKERLLLPGADPENIEPEGTNSLQISDRTGWHNFFILRLRANGGREPGALPLNPRLSINLLIMYP